MASLTDVTSTCIQPCSYKAWVAIQIQFSLLYTGLALQDGDLIELTPNHQQRVMIGDEVTITCLTRNLTFMAWSSEEYIGSGLRLEFNFAHETGHILVPAEGNSTTFANLTRIIPSTNFACLLESELHITVSADYPQFTVTCYHPENDLMKNITFLGGKIL